MVQDVYEQVEATAMLRTRFGQVAAGKAARIRQNLGVLNANVGAVQQFNDNVEKYWAFMAVVLVSAASFSLISGVRQLWTWIEKKGKNKLDGKVLQVTELTSHKGCERSNRTTRIHARSWEYDYQN